MKSFRILAALLLAASSLTATVAHAGIVLSPSPSDPSVTLATLTLSASDPTQHGRLSRNAIPQDFAGDEAFPGVINPTNVLHYAVFSLNVGNTPFIDIEVDGASTSTFVSAYQSAYNVISPSFTWLGDPGTSGDFFGPGTTPLFFDVVAQANSTLVIVLNETLVNGGLGSANGVTLTIQGFTDSEFDGAVDLTQFLVASPQLVVPEPSTLALLVLPVVAFGVSRRRKAKKAN
jgi:PEP-CTERM motif